MSLSEEKKIQLSQLVDGELPVDEANRLLAEVFDELSHVMGSAEAARQLHAMLRMREALAPWREQEPAKAVAASTSASALTLAVSRREKGRWTSLATAALLGGVLVAGGILLGHRLTAHRPDATIAKHSDRNADSPVVLVTPEQRRDIARAFALHESVAGPLSWYAADDATIQVAPAERGESLREPIAVVLRLSSGASSPDGKAPQPQTYVIVCRNNDAATIELPSSTIAPNLRLRLISTRMGDQVKLQYALAADGLGHGLENAVLAGGRLVGLGQTALGQLAMNDCLVNVDASAWGMEKHVR